MRRCLQGSTGTRCGPSRRSAGLMGWSTSRTRTCEGVSSPTRTGGFDALRRDTLPTWRPQFTHASPLGSPDRTNLSPLGSPSWTEASSTRGKIRWSSGRIGQAVRPGLWSLTPRLPACLMLATRLYLALTLLLAHAAILAFSRGRTSTSTLGRSSRAGRDFEPRTNAPHHTIRLTDPCRPNPGAPRPW